MISSHEYTLTLATFTGPFALKLETGNVALDGSRIPFIEASVTIVPNLPEARFDPRFPDRLVTLTCTRTDDVGTVTRVFDGLRIREVTPDYAAGTMTLRLASDESMLEDFGQLVDDNGPRVHETSLRGVVEYVLAKLGRPLQPGALDADVTAYWAVTNLIINASIELGTEGWLPGTGASALTRVASYATDESYALRWTASAGHSNVVPMMTNSSFYTVRAGEWYAFAFEFTSGALAQSRAAIQWWSQGGATPSATSEGVIGADPIGVTSRRWVIAQCPPGADRAVPFVNTIGNFGGELHYVDEAMFYQGNELIPFFHGGTPDDAHYTYDFQAAPYMSTSSRRPVIERRPESLLWSAGVSAMQFLHPLLMQAGFKLVCDENAEFSLRDDAYAAAGSQSYAYGTDIIEVDGTVSRDADDWYDAAVVIYKWRDADGIEQERTDAFATSMFPTKVQRIELNDTPYPGAGRAEVMVIRAQARGRTVTVGSVARWTEQIAQPVTVTIDGIPTQVGPASRIEWNLDDDTVRVTARTTNVETP